MPGINTVAYYENTLNYGRKSHIRLGTNGMRKLFLRMRKPKIRDISILHGTWLLFHSLLIVRKPQLILEQQLRPHPIDFLSINVIFINHNY